MPCRDDYPSYTYIDVNGAREAGEQTARAQLEPLLCEACSLLEGAKVLQQATPELLVWYQKHEKCEEERVRLEAAQKLTERERRLLGINLGDLEKKFHAKVASKGVINRR